MAPPPLDNRNPASITKERYNMVRATGLALLLSALLTAAPALAGEVFVGGLTHDSSFGVSGSPHESGTSDYEIGVRTKQFENLWWILKPMVYAKGEFNTDNRTNFYTVGLEWRKHLFHSKFYGDFGVGGAYVDGYAHYPDGFQLGSGAPPVGSTPAQQTAYNNGLHIYDKFKAFGSTVLFNPNFSLGYDITPRISVEAAWEHYSNAGLGSRNPGMDNYGGRLVWHFGGPL